MNHEKLKSDLKAYCKDNFCNLSQLARKSGMSVSHMHNVVNGVQNSGKLFWQRLEDATGGEIKRGDYEMAKAALEKAEGKENE